MRNNYFHSQALEWYQLSNILSHENVKVFLVCGFILIFHPPPHHLPQKALLSVDNFPLQNVYKSNSHLYSETEQKLYPSEEENLLKTNKKTQISILKANFIENLNKTKTEQSNCCSVIKREWEHTQLPLTSPKK
jgi:hypothetical protein